MANKAITEFGIGTPSSSATVLGEDGGTVKRFNVSDLGGSGGGSIIYATEKPSTPSQAIYVITEDEVVKAQYVEGSSIVEDFSYEIVDVLPEVPNAAMDLSTGEIYVYYLTTTGEVSGYVDEAISNESSGAFSVGWCPFATLLGVRGATYAGEITSIDQATGDDGTGYTLVTKEPKTRVYVPLQDGTFLELTSGIRTRFDENSGTVSITEM